MLRKSLQIALLFVVTIFDCNYGHTQTFNQTINKSLPSHGGGGVYVTGIRQTNTGTIVDFEIQDLVRRDKNGKIKSRETFSISHLLYLIPGDIIPDNFQIGLIPWNTDEYRSTFSKFQASGVDNLTFDQSYYCDGGRFSVHFNGERSRIPYGPSDFTIVELVDWYVNGYRVGYRVGYKWKIHLSIPYPDVGSVNKNESQIRAWIDENNNGLYGIYRSTDSKSNGYTLAFMKDGSRYVLVYISSGTMLTHWQLGEIKAILEPTATEGLFVAKWRKADKYEVSGVYVTFDKGSMTVSEPEMINEMYLKMYPSFDASISSIVGEWSGTGFALKDGYIVTNQHVVYGAQNIKVYGVNGNFSRDYSARIVAVDKNNDLALIKIDDFSFNGFTTIPYSVKTAMVDVGEDVFVLGYPLTQLMGNEVKLTNGIVSSRSGFQGDVSTYQITAPVQPGNSGGPLFDKNGNIVGIINAGISGAENVGYAIKTSYLKSLIENVETTSILPNNNQISSLTLPQKVAKVKDFVFLIVCEGKQ